jgi:hypothetical protein
MLTNQELCLILKKNKLKLDDLLLIEHHLLSIQKIIDENEYLPEDVSHNLDKDVDLIITKLRSNLKLLNPPKLKLVNNKE